MGDRRAPARSATPSSARRHGSTPAQGTRSRAATIDPRQAPHDPTAAELHDLQRSAGNAAVVELVQRALDTQHKSPDTGKHRAPWMASKRPILRKGDGPYGSIAELQQQLNAVVAGKPLRITGTFDAATEDRVKTYQQMKGYPFVTGVVNKHTWWDLDQDAPRVIRQGNEVVLGRGRGDAMGTPDLGTTHPTIKLGSKGPAVEELQQKLNTLPAKDISIYLSTHGKFDKTTRIGVMDFQKSRKPPLKATGVVDKATWAALDGLAGPVKVGREDYEYSQRSEGTITGSKTAYTWRLLPDRLQVTVNIKFTGSAKHPMVAKWKQDITNLWNSFKFVKAGKPQQQLLLEFVIGSGSPVDARVKIVKSPKGKEETRRSDSGTWYTGDTDPGLAPHEFGHLIGLQDEYNKGPELYTIVTGEQPDIGVTRASNKKAEDAGVDTIATEMRKAVGGKAAGRGRRARAVVDKYELRQGAFAQRIAVAYEKANAGKLLREDYKLNVGYQVKKSDEATMADDLAARIPGRMNTAPDEYYAVHPFLYDNRGIMGSMQELSSPAGLDKHDHPVAERHVRHFLQIVQQNQPGAWKTVRR